ncbi:resistin-like [Mauremys mutica]|nr:resistin-like [Mauremys mutica]
MLYLLVAICFLMWIVLLSLTIKNDQKMTEELKTINAAISQRIDQDQKMTEELKTINALSHRINQVSSTLAKAKLLSQDVSACGALVSCPAGYKPTGCTCGMCCSSWDIRTNSTCHCQCGGIDWTATCCCKIGLE